MNVNKSDLISRQAAIDALEREKTYCTAFREGYTQINVFEKYNAGLTDGIKALKKLPSAQQWIPCSERMPEEDNETGNGVQYSNAVLITVFNKKDEETIIDFAHTANGTWYSYVSDCSIPHGWKVLAWMPLPEPYGKRRTDDVDVKT